MKLILKNSVLGLLVILAACQGIGDDNKSNGNSKKNIKNHAGDKHVEEIVYSLEDYFELMPEVIFDQTTDELGDGEKEALVASGESEFWKVTGKSDDKIKMECKYSSSAVSLYLLSGYENNALMLSYVENEQAATVKIWRLNDSAFVEAQLLPEISPNEFLSEQDSLDDPEKYKGNVYFYMDGIKLFAGLYTWMEPEFEKREIAYAIELNWDGEKFEVVKHPK